MQKRQWRDFQEHNIDKLQDSYKLMLKRILIDNHQVSIDNLYITGGLDFLVILLGKEFSSPKWCFRSKLRPKVWLQCGQKISEDWTINALRLVSELDQQDQHGLV